MNLTRNCKCNNNKSTRPRHTMKKCLCKCNRAPPKQNIKKNH